MHFTGEKGSNTKKEGKQKQKGKWIDGDVKGKLDRQVEKDGMRENKLKD